MRKSFVSYVSKGNEGVVERDYSKRNPTTKPKRTNQSKNQTKSKITFQNLKKTRMMRNQTWMISTRVMMS
jgi:hypothetical protein